MAFKVDPYFKSIENLLKRAKDAKSTADQWLSLHQEAYDFAMPNKETYRLQNQGARKDRHIFDSTAIEAVEIFVNKIQHGFFPPWQEWMEMTAGGLVPKDEKIELTRLLQESGAIFFSEFHQSNHTTEISPALGDWAIGSACMEVEEGRFDRNESAFHFINIPLSEIFPETPAYGNVKSSWREHKVLAENIKQNWAKAEIPKELQLIIDEKPQTKEKILNGQIFNPERNVYHQFIIWNKHLIFTQEFTGMRRIVFRASVTAGEVFGRGPVIRNLADIRTLNKVKEFVLNNSALQIAGVYTGVDDGVFNPSTVRIAPGSIIPVGSNNTQNPSLTPLARTGDIGTGQIIIENLQAKINTAFFAEPMGNVDGAVRSASEQIRRHQDNLNRTGTNMGRLFNEYIQPMVKACISILKSRGKLDKAFVVDGRKVRIKMVSPLAKQKELEDFQNSQVWYEAIQQLPPEIAMIAVKQHLLPTYWAEKLSISLDLVNTQKDIDRDLPAMLELLKQNAGGGSEGEV